jgi:hypothetical protein
VRRSRHDKLGRIGGHVVVALATFACGTEDAEGPPPPFFEWDHVAGRPRGPNPHFSFFVTSSDGLLRLPAGPWGAAPTIEGFGGNLGGLAGADAMCTHLAQVANPGDTKIWRAFLSTSGTVGPRVDAIDRIGSGPWYDFRGFKLANNLEGLIPVSEGDGRPRGAEPELAAMFTIETGDRARARADVDNHDTLTGSNRLGRLFDDGEGGHVATCEDWTSATVRGTPGTGFGSGGQIPVGHSWPRSDVEGRHWISEHTINGCEPGIDIDGSAGAPRDDFRVGAAGGYGGFYCFALNAIPPTF